MLANRLEQQVHRIVDVHRIRCVAGDDRGAAQQRVHQVLRLEYDIGVIGGGEFRHIVCVRQILGGTEFVRNEVLGHTLEVHRERADRVAAAGDQGAVGQRGDRAGVQAAGQQRAQRHVGDHLAGHDVVEQLADALDGGGQVVRVLGGLQLPVLVLGDAERVTQILSNLLSNAHKYTPDEGHIELSVETSGSIACVAITDSGIGLSTEEQAQLFTPFYRAHNPMTEAVGGTGLGLVITRSLVEMQGGEMQVSSVPGHGSTFGFTLPLAHVLEPSTFQQETLLGKRILVVDDETETRHLLRNYLQGAGYEVMTAPNAMTAFQLARTARPDLITLDMLLPNTADLPILELLKSDAITASIPVILLTVVNNDGQRRLLGATDYLDKPIEASDLLQRITTVFADQTQRLVLLVAPSSKNHELLISALREVGHRVTFVPDGRKLLALVKRAHPGIIILDATVPPMGGLALLQALRADPATYKLPVIMTGIQPGELGMHWHTLTSIGYVDIWGNPSHVKAIVQVITQRLQTGTSASDPQITIM